MSCKTERHRRNDVCDGNSVFLDLSAEILEVEFLHQVHSGAGIDRMEQKCYQAYISTMLEFTYVE